MIREHIAPVVDEPAIAPDDDGRQDGIAEPVAEQVQPADDGSPQGKLILKSGLDFLRIFPPGRQRRRESRHGRQGPVLVEGLHPHAREPDRVGEQHETGRANRESDPVRRLAPHGGGGESNRIHGV